MPHKHTRARPHAEFRHRSQIPMPAVEEVEQRLMDVLSPSLLAPRQLERRDPRQPHRLIRLRQRLLTLPVIVAIMVSLVWRRVPSIAEGQKVLAREGLLGMAPLQVSPQAHHQTAGRAAGRGDGPAVGGRLCTAAGAGAAHRAAPALGTGAGAEDVSNLWICYPLGVRENCQRE